MLKEKQNFVRNLIVVTDLLLVLGAFFSGHVIIQWLSLQMRVDAILPLYPVHLYLNLIPVILFLWSATLHAMGMYRSFRGRDLADICADICKSGFIVMVLFGGFAYLFRLQYVSRVFITLVMLLSGFLLMTEKMILFQIMRGVRKKGLNYRQIVIVGTGLRAQDFIDVVREHSDWGLRILGLIDDDPALVGREIKGCKVIGTLSSMSEILTTQIVDEVVFIVPRSWMGKIEDAISLSEVLGKRVSMGLDYFNMKFAKARVTDLSGFELLSFETTPDVYWQLAVKRMLDILMSLTILAVLSPFFLILVALVKMTSKGPLFFKQERCCLNGRSFMLYKFRTMVEDAEQRLEEIRKYNEMAGPAFKMTNDPRITPIGKWLRKFSLDEFPQLMNVLMGDMSIVGPRPPVPSEVAKYELWQRRRLSMRPGLTCLWQVSGRNKITSFDEWMRLDLSYIDHWSLWLDLWIFLKTIPVVILAHGAK